MIANRSEIKYLTPVFIAVAVLNLSACNGSGDSAMQAQDGVSGVSVPISVGGGPVIPAASTLPALGPSCISSDPNHVCLAVKYVVYTNAGTPVVSTSATIADVTGINQLWSQCNIGFQIENLMPVNPVDDGLTLNTANTSELDSIRRAFMNTDTLLVVTTGTWNRTGSLGSTSANAWTNMPGGGLYGVVLEAPVGDFAPIIAHELGHYLNLEHVSDASNVMNPTIYSTSTQLTSAQCTAARSAAMYWWAKMIRG